MTHREFNGARLRLGRIFQGLTTSSLGEKIGVSHSFIVQLETGVRNASPGLLDAISEQLGFAPDFFFLPLNDEFQEENVFFRKRKTTLVSVRNRALAHGTLFGSFVTYLDNAIHLPELQIPTIRVTDRESIERAAEMCRSHWGLTLNGPINNMVRVLENNGVVVTRFNAGAEKIDAFSRFGSRHVVVLNLDKGSTSRTRYDGGHECGHLVMHEGLAIGTALDDELETQADQFASAFLLPRIAFAREFPKGQKLDWPALFKLKQRWKVSLAAIIRRAYDLHLITASEYQRAYKYMCAHDWRKREPFEPDEESVELVPLAVEKLKQLTGFYPEDIARKLYWTPEVFEKVTGIAAAKPPKKQTSDEGPDADIISIEDARRALWGRCELCRAVCGIACRAARAAVRATH